MIEENRFESASFNGHGRTALQPTFETGGAEMVGHYYYSQIDNRYRLKRRGNT